MHRLLVRVVSQPGHEVGYREPPLMSWMRGPQARQRRRDGAGNDIAAHSSDIDITISQHGVVTSRDPPYTRTGEGMQADEHSLNLAGQSTRCGWH